MKYIVSFVIILLMINYGVIAQNYGFFFGQKPIVINQEDTLENPWAGGINSAQISVMDINFDDLPDLVIFDRTSYKITTFLQKNKHWVHAPEYASYFPKVEHFLLLRDYNQDGKKDIFTVTSFGISVYKNTSENKKISWELVANPLKSVALSQLKLNLKIDVTDIPAIVDIDRDGDLDILNFVPFTGQSVELHQNFGMEMYNTPDSLIFKKVTSRFGNFSECAACNQLVFGGQFCGSGRVEHAGSSLLMLDTDGDRNLDFLVGDVSCQNLIHLLSSGNSTQDSIIRFATDFPPKTPVLMDVFPASYYEDVTFDDVLDLLVSPNLYANEENKVDFKKSLWLYKNNIKSTSPDFEFIQTDFLQNTMIDFGESAQPVFVDQDGDHDLDLLVCNAGELNKDGSFSSRIYLLENINTDDDPVFVLKDKDFLGFSKHKIQFLKISFHDINQDHKLDFVYTGLDVKSRRFQFAYVENLGDQKMTFDLRKAQEIHVKIYADETPIFWDIDSDGDLDLLVGRYEGNLEYYENQGDMNFDRKTDKAGGIGQNFRQQVLVPMLVHLDDDQTPELLTLDRSGILRLYPHFTTKIFDVVKPIENLVFNRLEQKKNNYFFGKNTSLSVFGNKHLVIGMGAGGLLFLEKIQQSVTTSLEKNKNFGIRMYPNPADCQVSFLLPSKGGTLTIWNMLGEKIYSRDVTGFTKVNVSNLQHGVYVCKFIDQNLKISIKKLLIFHE